jgi:hypothetical protein
MRARRFLAAMLAASVGCGGGDPAGPVVVSPPPPPIVTSIEVFLPDTLLVGTSRQGGVTAHYDKVPDKIVTFFATWSSSDVTVATVTSMGLVTAVQQGTAEITATFGGKSASKHVAVWDPASVWNLLSLEGQEYFQDRNIFSDGIVFKWPVSALPLKAWADPGLTEDLDLALSYWGEKTGGEISHTMVPDSASAQILMVFSTSIPYPACGELGQVWQEGGAISRVILRYSLDLRCVFNESDRGKIVAHEVGHGIGLTRHSPPGRDLMSPEAGTWYLAPVMTSIATWLNMPMVMPGLPIPAQQSRG